MKFPLVFYLYFDPPIKNDFLKKMFMEEKLKYLIHVNWLRLCSEWWNSLRNVATMVSPLCLDARAFINEYICCLSGSRSRASALELTVVLIASRSRSRSLKISTDMNER